MKNLHKFYPGLSLVLFILLVVALGFIYDQFFKANEFRNMDHSAMNMSGNLPMNELMKNMPGMQGDRTKRFTVDWDYSEPVVPGMPSLMKFRVFNAANGEPVEVFTKNYTKLLHLIVVDSSLTSYQHLHPEFKDGWFEIPVTFPKEGRYNLYLDFVPLGAIEQQIAVSVKTAGFTEAEEARSVEDIAVKEDKGYAVNIDFGQPLKAAALSAGAQKISFEISKNGELVKTLKPYLAAFGHMVMINTQTYEYYHVHPIQQKELAEDASGGPKVEFIPMAMFQPIKPGVYRLFAQFNPDNNLIMTQFTVKVE